MKYVIARLLLLFVIVVSSLLLVDTLYRQQYNLEYPSMGPLWKHPPIVEPYEIVKVGNSHADDGITFEFYNLRGLELAGVAQRFRFDRVLLQQYENQIADDAIILIDVSHISFSHRKADQSDGMQGNYYGRVSPFLIPDLKVSDYLQTTVAPFIRSGYAWRKAYSDEVRERIAAEEKWIDPLEATASSEPKEIPFKETKEYFTYVDSIEYELAHPRKIPRASYVDNMNFIFNKWYHTEEFDPQYFAYNRRELEKLIAYCLRQNWRPVLITIPVTSILEEGLLDDYKQIYLYDNLAQTDTQGVEYIDFTTRTDFTDNMTFFSNADHLNERGRIVFSYLLLQELVERGYVGPEVDGYRQ